MASAPGLEDQLIAEGFSAGRQRLKDMISVLRRAGMETIEDFDGLPDFKHIRGLGHLLPDDALFLEGVCARINNPVCLFYSDFATRVGRCTIALWNGRYLKGGAEIVQRSTRFKKSASSQN